MLLEDSKITFRTVTIGDTCVGKTCIINRFLRSTFDQDQTNTIGSLFETYTTDRGAHNIELHLWDTAGQEQYRSLGSVYFRSAAAALIVYDITNKQSFLNCEQWLKSFRDASGEQSLVFLVGNKSDLDSQRDVTREEAQLWADKNGCAAFWETSAKTGDNVVELFEKIVDELYKSYVLDSPAVMNNLHPGRPEPRADQGSQCGC
ncbi:Ras family protein [Tritrichomonas foetus]|uniref:Ras family protein n=1 Tax=Tritrichomonas foetus TaxID=1144522 RepID=A0A1J4KRB8_9EUKA|nr:Ras family protein [Tritrichomonas foetus]|eukprot:OHT13480.1 Ras family protein [Tritrichomonas foetus]